MKNQNREDALDELLKKTLKGNHPPASLDDLEDMVMKSVYEIESGDRSVVHRKFSYARRAAWLSLVASFAAVVAILFMMSDLSLSTSLFEDQMLVLMIISGCMIAIFFQLSNLLSIGSHFRNLTESSR